MNVRFSGRARRRVRFVAEWWRKNRPTAPTLFADELHEVVERLKTQPALGREYESIRGIVVRRVLLPGSGQHVYYAIDEATGTVVIHTVWGARRGEPPRL